MKRYITNFFNQHLRVNDPVALKLLNKAGEMPSLEPPEDESIRTLYVGGLDARVSEQDLRDNFYAHGEIESIRMVLQRACAFVTYTTREGAEKAAEELSNKLVIRGLRLKLMWGRPQAPKAEMEGSDEAKQAAVAHSGMLPRAVISQQHNQLHPPGTHDQPQAMHYFNIPPPPPQQERAFYPSMDPQRMGALVSTHDAGVPPNGPTGSTETRPGPEKQHQHQHQHQQGHQFPYHPMHPPPPAQYQQQFYPPPYGYVQHYPPYPPYHSGMPPPPQSQPQPQPQPQPHPPSGSQQYQQQHSAPSGSAPQSHGGASSGSASVGSTPSAAAPSSTSAEPASS